MTDQTAPATGPGPASPQPKAFSIRYSARDLVSVAIFAVIFIVISYAIGMLGFASPLIWLLILPLTVLVNGITYMLFLTRVRHAGMVMLFGTVVALFYLLVGNSLVSTLGVLVLAGIAELIIWAGRYRSRWAAIWAYTAFGLAFFTPFLPLFYDRASFFGAASWAEMGEEYIRATDALITAPVLGVLALVLLLAGFLGGLQGTVILRRHFVRAGLA